MVRQLWRAALELLFPSSARVTRVRTLRLESLPLAPTTYTAEEFEIISLMPYTDPSVRDAIWALKYEGAPEAARLLAAALFDWLAETAAEAQMFDVRPLLVLPVPLAHERARERGYNQNELVLRELVPHPGYEIRTDLLQRTRETLPQTKLPRRERLTNVAGAFEARSGKDFTGRRIILLDDVTTTGATLVHAARTLRAAGGVVIPVALARAA